MADGGNLHVALALALGVQPAELDRDLIARVYRLTLREPPDRGPRALRDALVLALGVPASESDAQLIARVAALTGRDRPSRTRSGHAPALTLWGAS